MGNYLPIRDVQKLLLGMDIAKKCIYFGLCDINLWINPTGHGVQI